MIARFGILFAIISVLLGCNTIPKGNFEVPGKDTPDYSDLYYWASSPFKEDPADRTPGQDLKNNQSEAKADVFFIHPTTYTNQRGNNKWNGDIHDEALNIKTDQGTILFQASVYNGAARIFAPRYRQAHLHSFYTKDPDQKKEGNKALDFAYKDVKSAFQYYLNHHNNGRPIIIGAHSQGTTHAGRLIKDFFEEKDLMDQLVVAYLVGMPVKEDYFDKLKPCESEKELQCFCSWRSYQRNYLPNYHQPNSNIVVTNPLSWKTDDQYIAKELNQGTLLRDFDEGLLPGISDAQVYEDFLWVTKPKFKGSIFVQFKNYHIADYNLFYANIRENVINRVDEFVRVKNKNGNL